MVREKSVRIAVGVCFDLEHVDRTEIRFVVQEIVDAGSAIRLFPAVRQIWFVIRPDDARIGGDDQAPIWVQGPGKLFERRPPCPLVLVGIAGNRDFAVSLFSNRDARGHHVTDVAVHIGVDGVLSRAPNGFHDFSKFVPVLRSGEPVVRVS